MNGKRILICCNRPMGIGGIEKALTTLLTAFNTRDNEVHLVIHDATGAFQKDLPLDEINVFYTNTIDAKQYLKDDIRNFRILNVIEGLWNRILLRIDSNWYAQIMYMYRLKKRGLKIPGHFDCAIAFSTDYSDMAMVLNADADKKAAFIHGDATFNVRAARLNEKLVSRMDKIFSVSDRAKELFVRIHPSCESRVEILHNVVLKEDIWMKANEPATDMVLDGKITLCTVARMVPEKGQYMIPEIAEKLCKDGWDFRWYLVGDGSDRSRVEAEIRNHGMENRVFLLGSRPNPYPYMKNCHIYVQPSFHEALCTTTLEAKTLCKPVVTTDAAGMREQFNSGENGLIVDAITAEGVYKGIVQLLEHPEMRDAFSRRLEETSNGIDNDLSKLYEFIEN